MGKEEIKEVAQVVIDNTIFTTKEILTSEEAARYMGVARGYLHKLTMRGIIPYYKPMGKKCYFKRTELEEFLQSNRVATSAEIGERANAYLMKGGER